MSNDRVCIVLFPISFFYTIQFLEDLLFLNILHPWLLTCTNLNNFAFPFLMGRTLPLRALPAPTPFCADLEGSPEAEEQRTCTKLPTQLLWSQSWDRGCDLSTQSTCYTASSGRVEGWVLMPAASVGH